MLHDTMCALYSMSDAPLTKSQCLDMRTCLQWAREQLCEAQHYPLTVSAVLCGPNFLSYFSHSAGAKSRRTALAWPPCLLEMTLIYITKHFLQIPLGRKLNNGLSHVHWQHTEVGGKVLPTDRHTRSTAWWTHNNQAIHNHQRQIGCDRASCRKV